jgi:N-acetylglucosaminyldiphosphoundecaprenol N-acetyl-beta-D-mannosaminyltransferase
MSAENEAGSGHETFAARRGAKVLDVFIDAGGWDEALRPIGRWASGHRSSYVCVCNTHSLTVMRQSSAVRQAIQSSDLATPDGMPVALMLRRLGFHGQPRINGPDLMWRLCGLAEQSDIAVFFYGNTEATLAALQRRLEQSFPRLTVAGTLAPPFRALTPAEDRAAVDAINRSGAGLVFVSLGCPKQELWMAEHRGRIDAVMIGVGAAFDFHAGTLKRAPRWMQRAGLEWLHRLAGEPRRLWRRYLVSNTLFLVGAIRQLCRSK